MVLEPCKCIQGDGVVQNFILTCSVHYAAIGAGSLAIICVLIYIIHQQRRRRLRSSRSIHNSASQSHLNTPKSTGSSGGLGGFFGYPRSPHNISNDGHHPQNDTLTPISNSNVSSPSSPRSGPGRLKKSNSAPRPRLAQTHVPQYQGQGQGQGQERIDEETEMVMVTYEEGLKKLGLERIPEHQHQHQQQQRQLHHQQQHGIYPDSPIMDHEGEITIGIDTPTPILSSGSSRPTPTTAQLLSPSKSGNGKRYHEESQYRAGVDVSPIVGRTKIGRLHDDGVGRFPTDSELGTNCVPSYYHLTTAAIRGRPESPPSAYSGTR